MVFLSKYPKLYKAWVSVSLSLNNYIARIHFTHQENSDTIKKTCCLFQNSASGF